MPSPAPRPPTPPGRPPAAASHRSPPDELVGGPDRSGRCWLLEHGHLSPHRESHWHAELEFNLVVAGRVVYVVNGRRVELTPDAAFWLWPSQEHLLLWISEDFRMYVVIWRQEAVRAAAGVDGEGAVPLGDAAADTSLLPPRRLDEAATASLKALLNEIRQAPDSGHEAAGFGWLLRQAWAAFLAADGVPGGTRLHPGVERAARWLAAHAHQPAAEDLGRLAQRCGLSRSRLSRLFAQQVGETLRAYRQRRRLEAALQHLGSAGRDGTPGRATLLDAAIAGGFGSYAAFYRAHVRYRGAGPTRARRS